MKDKVLFSHTYEMRIPFFDVDMLEIAWHGHYVKYFEEARCEMLEKIGYNYLDMKKDGYAWPIVDMHLKYMSSAKFTQLIKIRCDLVEYENRLKINYLIYDSETGQKLTKGYTIQLAVDVKNQQASFVTPKQWQQKIKEIL